MYDKKISNLSLFSFVFVWFVRIILFLLSTKLGTKFIFTCVDRVAAFNQLWRYIRFRHLLSRQSSLVEVHYKLKVLQIRGAIKLNITEKILLSACLDISFGQLATDEQRFHLSGEHQLLTFRNWSPKAAFWFVALFKHATHTIQPELFAFYSLDSNDSCEMWECYRTND